MGFLLHDGVRAELLQPRECLGGGQSTVIMIRDPSSRCAADYTGRGGGHSSTGWPREEPSDSRAQLSEQVPQADKAVGAGGACSRAAFRGVVRRDHDDRRRVRARFDLAGRLQTVHSRQVQLHQHQVRR